MQQQFPNLVAKVTLDIGAGIHIMCVVITVQISTASNVTVAQIWDFRPPDFYINKSYLSRWLMDLGDKQFFFFKTEADISHFLFFAQAERALRSHKHMLSVR